MNDSELYAEARRQVERRSALYGHALVYVIVNTFLIALNLVTTPGYWWAAWSVFGWGIGLAIQTISYAAEPALRAHTEREVERIVARARDSSR